MSKKRIFYGYELCENGIVRHNYFQEQQLRRAFSPPPVIWDGEPASLYFWNYYRTSTPVNQIASNLITHTGFIIRGPAFVITGSERWHHFRAVGTAQQVQAKLANVLHGLSGKIIFRPSGRWETHQNIYVEKDDDAVAVRMAL
ncbi:hypothetical protein ACFOYU_13130 [Microvirga sp. GCM10011540]|uniref:hypothetical protein n=1 Tax=Microvirga sp. GCM10011540 TaxID=3317338 RepID=UPI00361C6778